MMLMVLSDANLLEIVSSNANQAHEDSKPIDEPDNIIMKRLSQSIDNNVVQYLSRKWDIEQCLITVIVWEYLNGL